jgi:hypothetical protein
MAGATEAPLGWAGSNGIAFDQGRQERHSSGEVGPPFASIRVGDKEISFNKEATRWLGVWLDSQLTTKEHRGVRRRKEG